MLGRIIFCVVIAAAVLAVVLLATVSPLPRRTAGHKGSGSDHTRTLTVYIHPTPTSAKALSQQQEHGAASAFVFRHRITAGPESASRTVGVATGFVLRGEAAMEVFDTVHLAFEAVGMSGSVCIQAAGGGEKVPPRPTRRRRGECGGEEVVRVVGGTGAFAFVARGEGVVRAECPPATRVFGGAAAAAKVLRLELCVATAKSY